MATTMQQDLLVLQVRYNNFYQEFKNDAETQTNVFLTPERDEALNKLGRVAERIFLRINCSDASFNSAVALTAFYKQWKYFHNHLNKCLKEMTDARNRHFIPHLEYLKEFINKIQETVNRESLARAQQTPNVNVRPVSNWETQHDIFNNICYETETFLMGCKVARRFPLTVSFLIGVFDKIAAGAFGEEIREAGEEFSPSLMNPQQYLILLLYDLAYNGRQLEHADCFPINEESKTSFASLKKSVVSSSFDPGRMLLHNEEELHKKELEFRKRAISLLSYCQLDLDEFNGLFYCIRKQTLPLKQQNFVRLVTFLATIDSQLALLITQTTQKEEPHCLYECLQNIAKVVAKQDLVHAYEIGLFLPINEQDALFNALENLDSFEIPQELVLEEEPHPYTETEDFLNDNEEADTTALSGEESTDDEGQTGALSLFSSSRSSSEDSESEELLFVTIDTQQLNDNLPEPNDEGSDGETEDV